MRAREFTINVPINIKINGDGDPEIDVDSKNDSENNDNLDQNPVMMSPQQQELELKKSEQGKESPSIDKMLDDDSEGDEDKTDQDIIKNLKILSGLSR